MANLVDDIGLFGKGNRLEDDIGVFSNKLKLTDDLGIYREVPKPETPKSSKLGMVKSDIEPLPEADVSTFGPRAVGAIIGGVKEFEGSGFGGIAGLAGDPGPTPEDPFAEPRKGSLEAGGRATEAMSGHVGEALLKTSAQQEGVQALMLPIEKLKEASLLVGDTVQKAVTGVGATPETPFAEQREGAGIPELGATVATAFEGMAFFYGMPKAAKWAGKIIEHGRKGAVDRIYLELKDARVQEAAEAYEASKKGVPLTEPDMAPEISSRVPSVEERMGKRSPNIVDLGDIPASNELTETQINLINKRLFGKTPPETGAPLLKPDTTLVKSEVPKHFKSERTTPILAEAGLTKQQIEIVNKKLYGKILPETGTPLLKPDVTPVKSARVPTVEERLGKRPASDKVPIEPSGVPKTDLIAEPSAAEKAPEIAPVEAVEPVKAKPEPKAKEPISKLKLKKSEIEVTTKGAEKEVSVDIPKAEAGALVPKEQKAYLIAEIDTAIAKEVEATGFSGTLEEAADMKFNVLGEATGFYKFEVPGDGTFEVVGSQLFDFKKRVKSIFPAALPKPYKPKKFGRPKARQIPKADRDAFGDVLGKTPAEKLIPKDVGKLLTKAKEEVNDYHGFINWLLGENLKPETITQIRKSFLGDKPTTTPSGKPEKKGTTLSILGTQEIYKGIKGAVEKLSKEGVKLDPGDKIGVTVEKSRQESRKIRGASLEKLKKATVRKIIDVSGNAEKLLLKDLGERGREVAMRHNLTRGASSEAKRQFDIISGEIYKDISKTETHLLDEHLMSTRAVEISKYKPDFKHAEGITAAEHANNIKQFQGKIQSRLGVSETEAKKIHTTIKGKTDRYFKETQNQLKQLSDEGLVTKEGFEALSRYSYEPRQVLDYIDPDRTYTFEGRKTTVPDSGIKKLTEEGSLRLIETDSQMLLQEVVARTQSRIFKNRANKALYNLAKEVPDNGIVEISKVAKRTKDGKPVYQKAPVGHEVITVMIDGKPQEMIMPQEFAKEWVKNDPAINSNLVNALSWISGNKILKAFATGYNPGFALTNIPRDIGLIYHSTDVYSPTLPKYLTQVGIDVVSVANDAWFQKGRWTDYVKEGGGMDFLTSQGQVSTKLKGKIGVAQDYLSYINSFSERITRLALRERALKAGKSPIEATWTARNYLDFSKGGSWTKAVDQAGVPYLNAGLQATRGIARAAINNPKLFTYKVANVMALASGIYYANRYTNPEAFSEIPARIRESNWIITTPFYRTDKETGKKRYFYIKIAKDQGQRVMASVAEGVLEKIHEGKFPTDQMEMAIKDFLSFIPLNKLPPALTAWFGYSLNKNFWMNQDIWRKYGKIDPKEEYTDRTHPFFVDVGQKTGLSPERTKYGLSQFFTYSNPYVGLVGGGYKWATEGLPDDFHEKTFAELIKSVPGAKRVFQETPAYSEKQREEIKDVRKSENTKKWVQSRSLNGLIENYYKDESQKNKAAVVDFIKSEPPENRKMLYERFRGYRRVQNLQNKWWWLDAKSLSPEARAIVFWNDWRQKDKQGQNEMLRNARRVPGFASKRFRIKFGQAQRKSEITKKTKTSKLNQTIKGRSL